jgi:hypothetical protein
MKRLLAVVMLALASLTLSGTALADHGQGEHVPVSICHRTASDTNPYVFITVDDDSLSPGHLDNADPGHKPTFWKSDGTWRGVEHVAGDPKDDYLAESKADCEDTTPPPPPPPDCEDEGTCPEPPPPTDPPEPPKPPKDPPAPPEGCKNPPCELAFTGFDAGTAGGIAVVLAALGGGAMWYARKLRVR